MHSHKHQYKPIKTHNHSHQTHTSQQNTPPNTFKGELDDFDKSTKVEQETIKSLAASEEREKKTRMDLAQENREKALALTAGIDKTCIHTNTNINL